MTKTQGVPHDSPVKEFTQVLKDLAVLSDGPSVDLHLSFDQAVLSMRSHDRLVWEIRGERGWARAEASARVNLLLQWLREAAEKYRRLKSQEEREKDEEA